MLCHAVGTSFPTGLTQPSPVTTTRFSTFPPAADFTALTPQLEDRFREEFTVFHLRLGNGWFILVDTGQRWRINDLMKPTFTVVIPVFNEAESITEFNRRL